MMAHFGIENLNFQVVAQCSFFLDTFGEWVGLPVL